MAVYVDAAIWKWKDLRWCHLLADDVDELHRFAHGIGVKKASYQGPPRTATPHYDLTGYERRLALRAGAIACSRQEIIAIARLSRGDDGATKQEGPPDGSPSTEVGCSRLPQLKHKEGPPDGSPSTEVGCSRLPQLKHKEGPPDGGPSIVSPREAGLTDMAPAQEAPSSQEARIQVTATRGARQ